LPGRKRIEKTQRKAKGAGGDIQRGGQALAHGGSKRVSRREGDFRGKEVRGITKCTKTKGKQGTLPGKEDASVEKSKRGRRGGPGIISQKEGNAKRERNRLGGGEKGEGG